MKIIPRTEWGAKRTPRAPRPIQRVTGFYVHYHGGPPPTGVGVWVPRNIEAIHLANGWNNGVGYHFMVDQAGTIYEGRGWDNIGAHSPPHNTDGLGVYVAIGGDQKPTDAALASVRALYDEACKKTGRTLYKRWHGYDYPTACPGPHLIAWVKAGMPVTGKTSTPAAKPSSASKPKPTTTSKAPAFPLPRGSYFGPKSGPAASVSGYYSHRADLKRWQAQMRKRGWSLTADGLYGPTTVKVARQFQKEKGLPVDGLIGAATWAAAWNSPVS